jgi:hypothetical protein
MMPEQGKQNDDWQRHAEQPMQSTSSKTHDFLQNLLRERRWMKAKVPFGALRR